MKCIKNAVSYAAGGALFFFIGPALYSLAWYAGSQFINEGYEANDGESYDAGVVLIVTMSMLMSNFTIMMALPCIKEFTVALTATQQMLEIINRQSQIDLENESKISLDKMTGKIEFQNVSFHYPGRSEIKVLDGFNLKVEPNKTVALCGPSGSGKSTVFALLQRFYDPIEGNIKIDDYDIRDLNFKSVMKFVSLVSQEPVLFSGTIEYNIKFGKNDATMEEIIQAAKEAKAHDFIEQTELGYQTQIIQGGKNISGGQKQRIAIARAIIKQPKILLLDEATSALDTTSEREVQEAIQSVSTGRTVFVIAHRLTTIQNSDWIVVLHQGKVAEQDTHENLMKLRGIYYTLADKYQMQQAEQQRKKSFMEKMQIKEEKKEEEVEKEEKKEEKQKKGNFIKRSVSSIKSKTFLLIIGTIGAAGQGLCYPAQGYIFIKGMEYLNAYEDFEEKNNNLALIWLCVAIYCFIAFFSQVVSFGIFAEYLTDKMRRLSMQSVLNQDVQYFDYPEQSPFKVCNRLQSDTVKINGAAGQLIGMMFFLMFGVFGGMAIAFAFCFWIGILMVAYIPFFGFFQSMMIKIELFGQTDTSNYMESNQLASESILNIKTVRACNNEKYVNERYSEILDKIQQKSEVNSSATGVLFGLGRCTMWGTFAMFYIFGAFIQRESDDYDFKDTMIALMAAVFGLFSIGDAQIYGPDIVGGKSAASSIWELIDSKPILTGETDAQPTFSGNVRFENVSFRYPSRPNLLILKDFNLEIEASEKTALVGHSGNGKSTIVQLILRFYDINEGNIFFDDIDIRQINIFHLRKQIGMVGQEPVLFQGTILENIEFGRKPDTQDEALRCAKLANLDLERTPMDTEVGLRGEKLSGGQKQRVAIARAIFNNPGILLLDEATSALDKETEKQVQEDLKRASEGRTVVVIAHRLSTIQDAHKICVIHEGRIIQQGNHASLMAEEDGIYYSLAKTMG